MPVNRKKEFYFYKEQNIPLALQGIIAKSWLFSANSLAPGDKRFNVLPGNSQCLIITDPFNISAARIFVCGPSDKYICITNEKRIYAAGFVFSPGIFKKLFNIDPSDTYNLKVPLNKLINKYLYKKLIGLLIPVRSEERLIKLVYGYILSLAKNMPPFSEAENMLINIIGEIKNKNGNIKLIEIYKKYSISSRQIQRLFRNFAGITPKEFCRLERFQKASDRLVFSEWSNMDLMFESGYYDQAHYNREFRKLTGLAPKGFLAKQKRIKFAKYNNF